MATRELCKFCSNIFNVYVLICPVVEAETLMIANKRYFYSSVLLDKIIAETREPLMRDAGG